MAASVSSTELAVSPRRALSRSLSWHPPPEALLRHISDDDGTASVSSADDADDDADRVDHGPTMTTTTTTTSTATQADGGGAIWHAKIVPDDYSDPRSAPGGQIKACRPMPMIKVSELLGGLEFVNERWLYRGPLNGWPGLVDLELKSITRKRRLANIASDATTRPREALLDLICCGPSSKPLGGSKISATPSIRRLWSAGAGRPLPEKSAFGKGTRGTFQGPPWTQPGFLEGSKGFVWWFTPRCIGARPGESLLVCGEQILDALDKADSLHSQARAVRCHAFAHRYPVARESLQDRQTYHTGVLVEWDHGRFCSVVELAWLYGCSGYNGRSNWCEDKLENPTELFEAMPSSLKIPWDTDRSEIRVYDVPMTSKDDFHEYLNKYSTKGALPATHHRFLEPEIYASSEVRLRFCSPSQLAGHLLNYISRADKYELMSANCQTFTADLFGFLAGEKDSKPYGKLVQANYTKRVHSFLYEPRYD